MGRVTTQKFHIISKANGLVPMFGTRIIMVGAHEIYIPMFFARISFSLTLGPITYIYCAQNTDKYHSKTKPLGEK